jgi:hypothetical protein
MHTTKSHTAATGTARPSGKIELVLMAQEEELEHENQSRRHLPSSNGDTEDLNHAGGKSSTNCKVKSWRRKSSGEKC